MRPVQENLCVGKFGERVAEAASTGIGCRVHHGAHSDAGLTEFGGVPTYTALAIGPDEEAKLDELTKDLQLL